MMIASMVNVYLGIAKLLENGQGSSQLYIYVSILFAVVIATFIFGQIKYAAKVSATLKTEEKRKKEGSEQLTQRDRQLDSDRLSFNTSVKA